MALEEPVTGQSPSVCRVIATVSTVPEVERRNFLEQVREREMARDPDRFERFSKDLLSPNNYRARVWLAAELSDGRVVQTRDDDLRPSGPRRGVGAIYWRYRGPRRWWWPGFVRDRMLGDYRVQPHDIEDAINHMLGRDPALIRDMHPPLRLAWGNLLCSLRSEHVDATEDELINAPLSVEFTAEAEADLFGQH